MIKENLEKDILLYGLLIGIGYQLYQTLLSVVPQLYVDLALVNMLITLILFFLYLLVQQKGARSVLLIALHLCALTALTFFWKNYGGMSGTAPSFFCVYTSFIVVCSHGWAQRVVILTLSATLAFYFLFPAWLGMTSPFEPSRINALQRNVDYVVVGGLIISFTLYMKRKFVFYRDRVSNRYRQLDQIAQTLQFQNQELATRQEETRAINDNLESLVADRMREVENKNQALAEYAFINAHMLRGPLCRILGLIHLMEKEEDRYSPRQLAQLRATAQEIDQRVKEINSVIS
jgi:signal transduction histidine kinase